MKVHVDCIPCLLRQALDATKLSTANFTIREMALRQVLTYLSNEHWNKTTPELATNVHRIIKKIASNDDPYKQLKEKYTRIAMHLYPKLMTIIKNSPDPLQTAVKVAIAGNMIDFGPKTDINLENDVENVLANNLAINDIDRLKQSLSGAKKVLYLADNAGETVFDKALIDELLKQNLEVTYAVKGAPILNDATLLDAEMAGITKIADVMSIGSDCTGILFNECSPEFIDVFQNSDLIISKGQGNYESLNDVQHVNMFFLLKVKCPIIAQDVGAQLGSAILKKCC